jgi:prephenate dehydrogenase
LIGASIGLALRSQGWSTVGWDPNQVTLGAATSKEAVDAAADAGSCVVGADLVFLAGPLDANLELLRNLGGAALTTDVTSVKRPLLEVVPEGCRFIGGHPMAGREHAGPAAATPASHLPHVLAAVLTGMADDHPEGSALVSGSFRDLTRVASSDAGWWPEVLVANADEVSDAIHRLVDRLQSIDRLLGDGDIDGVRLVLEQARESRAGMAPRLSGVQVVLQDRPGELAAVGRAFSTSHVDVRDLQLRHAEHGGGGVLTITVRPGEAEPLRQALEQEGFTLE